MGTQFSVAIVTATEFDQEQVQAQIRAVLEDVDMQMSTYQLDSELTELNRINRTGWIPVSRDLCAAIDDALKLGERTAGAFDITVGPLVNLWGFGPEVSRLALPTDDAIDQALTSTGYENLHADCVRPAVRKDNAALYIDLSGYAKGHAADKIATLLDEHGMLNYLAEVGGDLRARGRNRNNSNWRIAIEKPDPSGAAVEKIIRISDFSVATSGDYRNFFEFEGQRYSHTIDPQTGWPVRHSLASVTVLAASAAHADALATALLVLGPDAGPAFAEHERIAAYFLMRDERGLTERMSTQFAALAER